MAVNEKLIKNADRMLRVMRPTKDIERLELVDLAIGEDGKARLDLFYGSQWNTDNPFYLGPFHLWVDSSQRLRMKQGRATSDTDGKIIG